MLNSRGRHFGLIAGLFIALASAGVHVVASSESKAVGPKQVVSVIDGDTVEVDGRTIQLYGIDAPELGQLCLHDSVWTNCGQSAAFELNKLLNMERAPFECVPAKAAEESNSRICKFAHTDVARVLLESGYAIAAPDTSPDYAEVEDLARQGALGLWHSRYVIPSRWRAGERLPGEDAAKSKPCPIKAAMGVDNRRVYYVPTDPAYPSVEIDPSRGDRFYCSDEEARQDGWGRVAPKISAKTDN